VAALGARINRGALYAIPLAFFISSTTAPARIGFIEGRE
jgi:hypothetical protein